MADGPPRSIRYFEALTFASFAIGMIHQLAVTDVGLGRTIFSAAIPLGLTLLVSRGRKNWARWVLAVMFLIGVGLIVIDLLAGASLGSPPISILVMLLQAIALALLFKQDSSDWLRRKPPLTDTFS